MTSAKRCRLATLFVALTTATAGLAQAVEFTVLNLKDTGKGTLRQAVTDSNRRAGADVIRFASGLSGTIILSNGVLSIGDDLTIEGPGAGVSVWPNCRGRVATEASTAPSSPFGHDLITTEGHDNSFSASTIPKTLNQPLSNAGLIEVLGHDP